jgi:hypothetical protein
MGSFVVTSAMIRESDRATAVAVRRNFDRIAESYRRGPALSIPIAFHIGAATKPG